MSEQDWTRVLNFVTCAMLTVVLVFDVIWLRAQARERKARRELENW